MKSADYIKKFFNKAAIDTNPSMDKAVLNKILTAHEKANTAVTKLNIRRTIMKSPITKLAVAAAVIAVVVLGLVEFIGTGSTSGVVWAEVARKVEASRGLIYRSREVAPDSRDDAPDYSMNYLSAMHRRTDSYKGVQITVSHYLDFDGKTGSSVFHTRKLFWCDAPLSEQSMQEHENWTNPKWLVQTILSCEHRKLGQKTVEGVLCEGLETTDPTVFGSSFPVPISSIDMYVQLWVSVETGYPVLLEVKVSAEHDGNVLTREEVLDQFQWDVELDASIFEPNIPSDYIDISP